MEWDTGTDDVQNYGQILGFKTSENDEYMSDLEFWPEDSYCSQIRGTDGTSAPTHLKKGEKIWIFSPDLFRSFYLDYVDEARSPAYNIQTYRYEASSYLYERPNVNPDNACFCYGNYWWDTKDNGLDCLNLAGGYVADVANFGIPLLLSSPHFLDGEPLREIAYGDFNPNREEHCTYLEFESISGTAIKAAKRIQESLVQVRDPHYPMLANIPLDEKTIIMPLLWLNESVTITEDLEQEIYISAVVGLQVLMAAYIILIAGGVILMATSWFVVNKRNASCSDFIRCKTPEK